jgi:hypothetical protein
LWYLQDFKIKVYFSNEKTRRSNKDIVLTSCLWYECKKIRITVTVKIIDQVSSEGFNFSRDVLPLTKQNSTIPEG